MNISINKIINSYIFFSFFLIFFFSPFHNFNIWEQVLFLRGTELKLGDIFSQAHFLRYILVLPIFFISELFSQDIDAVFKVVCTFNLALITKNCISLSSFYLNKNIGLITSFYILVFIIISAFMNGRIVFSFLGYSYLLLSLHKWEASKVTDIRFIYNIFLSLMLCSVSTGTFLSCIILLTIWMISSSIFKRKKFFIRLYMLVLFLLLSPIIILYLSKNIIFYGGGLEGFINMLNHGAGALFSELGLEILILLIINSSLILIIFALFFNIHGIYRLQALIIFTSLFAGLYGYSTLALSLIPISLFLLITLVKTLKFFEQQHSYKLYD